MAHTEYFCTPVVTNKEIPPLPPLKYPAPFNVHQLVTERDFLEKEETL
jgi:hypothetical protein